MTTPAIIPENFLRHGAAGLLPDPRILRAGPLTMQYENGDLRYIRLGDREVVRRITIAVRDRNWGTVPVQLTPVATEVAASAFKIVCEAVARRDEIDFRWRATLTGTADGRVECEMDGRAWSTFLRNRIGFCVLHPPRECGGARCRVHLPDQRIIEGVLPRAVAPGNPFSDMVGFEHEVMEGVWCRLQFEGDTFEMEDQRNWLDASFKTFCTPLHRAFPVAVLAGTEVHQAIRLSLTGAIGEQVATVGSGGSVRISPSGAARQRLPAIGLAAASHEQPLSAREVERVQALRPAHLRVDLHPGAGDGVARLRAAAALQVPLEIALFLRGEGTDDLRRAADAVAEIRPQVARWLVFHTGEVAASSRRWVDLARTRLAEFGPAPFVTGTDCSFVEINRCRPPREGIDGVCFSLNPQVHASDHASLVETLAMHGELIESARDFSGALPLSVSTVTFRMRANPAATGPERVPGPGELPARVDPRQLSLFGAGWTLGSIKYLAEAGVASVTYFETTGWLGVMETEAGSPEPALFPSIPGAVFPLYHVFADCNAWTGAEVIPCVSSDPLQVEALILEQTGGRRVVVANLTPGPVTVQLPVAVTGGREGKVRRLSASTAITAMRAPQEFRRAWNVVGTTTGDDWRLDLGAFDVLTLDVGRVADPGVGQSSLRARACEHRGVQR